MTTALRNEIKSIFRESIRDVLLEELPIFRALSLDTVSPLEQNDIVKRYKKPTRTVARTISVRI